jgi:FtsP/CotA-like multicopper oxidase with cupredoxin domain
MCKLIIFFLFVLCHILSIGATLTKRLYINRGSFVTVKNTTFPFLAFNKTTTFNQLNENVNAVIGDTIKFVVINNDTALHGFAVKGTGISSATINPGDSVTYTLSSATVKAFVYYDHYLYPNNRFLGLGGIVYFAPANSNKTYYWNIKEHQTSYHNTLATGGSVNWNNYEPDYYTINSKSFPDLQTDTLAKINAQVGDTFYIVVANTGQSAHSLHFHGFHAKSLYADAKVMRANWDKDTWGTSSMDVMVLQVVPDKPGQYSVHDHNLVAITGGNTHPNGMFTIMDIAP